jgi:hypothetical protein
MIVSENKGNQKADQKAVSIPIVRLTRDEMKDLIEDIRKNVKLKLPQMAEDGSEIVEDALQLVIRAVMAQNNMLDVVVPMQQVMGTIWMLLSRVTESLRAVAENAANRVDSAVTIIEHQRQNEDVVRTFEEAEHTVNIANLALKIAPLVVVRLVAANLPPEIRPPIMNEAEGVMMPVIEQPKKSKGWF